jgi:hypothetical protein
MKNLLKLSLLVIVVITIQSCTKDELIQVEPVKEQVKKSEPTIDTSNDTTYYHFGDM